MLETDTTRELLAAKINLIMSLNKCDRGSHSGYLEYTETVKALALLEMCHSVRAIRKDTERLINRHDRNDKITESLQNIEQSLIHIGENIRGFNDHD